jgi:predicted N-formylglutamate amidohydrolase
MIVVSRPFMPSPRAELAQYILETLESGGVVPFNDAIRLRNWAVRTEDIFLPLDEIARHILEQENNPNAKAAEQE